VKKAALCAPARAGRAGVAADNAAMSSAAGPAAEVSRRPAPLFLALAVAAACAAFDADAARLALVVGNDNYLNVSKLRNARNDAQSLARELESAGFKVTRVLDATRDALNESLDAFLRRVEKGDEVVFFFSGHGSQPPQMGPFLLPVDIRVTGERAIQRDGLSLEQLVDDLNRRARFSLVIIDACRDDPFRETVAGRSLPSGSGLARIEPPKGTMIIMAASKGQQALDRLSEKDPVNNGLFTRELVKQMRQPGQSAGEMLKKVRANVESAARAVNHEQRPSLVDESSSDFFFFPGRAPAATAAAEAAPAPAPAPAPDSRPAPGPAAVPSGYGPQREFDAWDTASRSGTRAAFEGFIGQFPNGRYAPRARALLADLVAGTSAASTPQPVAIQPAAGRTRAEPELWERAAASKRRADYEAYLAIHPDGRHADQAREALKLSR
jgi:hypothetical protein